MRARRRTAPALAAALVLWTGGAAAQTPACTNAPAANQRIECEVAGGVTEDIDIDAANVSISTTGDSIRGVHARHEGAGGIDIALSGGSVTTADDSAEGVRAWHAGAGDISIRMRNVAVSTGGAAKGQHAPGVTGFQAGGPGGVSIEVEGGSIRTRGATAAGVSGRVRGAGDVVAALRDAAIETTGRQGVGVFGTLDSPTSAGDLSIRARGGSIRTAGEFAHGVWGSHTGSGRVEINVADVAVTTTGDNSPAVYGHHVGASGRIDVDLEDAAVTTAGDVASGVFGYHTGESGDIAVTVRGGSITTAGDRAYGIIAWRRAGTGGASVSLSEGVSVETRASSAHAVYAYHAGAAGRVFVNLGAAVTTAGPGARGLLGLHAGLGAVEMTADAGATIRSPFSIGAEGRLTNDANAAGRVLIAHRGAMEARDSGIFARAARASGHDLGEGAETAEDAARTEPMIQVTSSGDVTVGLSVMDDFIRERIAGDDGALSAGEQAVLSAVEAEDSDALDAALAALPESYADDYRAEARSLLAKRGYEPTSAAARASGAAEEILGLSRAGVRAVALNHEEIANHVRRGDALSDAERTVLAAILTGGDLEAALAALPAEDYPDAWKEGARRLAATYNAGGIRVDLTGGAIAAEGNGAEALYAVPHERNGAIAVSVAWGASVTGGRNGLYLSGAGAGEGNFPAQSVRVDGAVAGGDGAGVYMRGGGRLMVGETGRISAASGAAVLADGPGDFYAAIAGRVEGDIRGTGSGAHTVEVAAGGEVTGTIHLAASEVRVDGTVGSVRFDRGGTLTVGPAGVLRGIDGAAVRSSGGAASRLHFSASLPRGRSIRAVIGDAWLVNDGGGTDIFVNGVKLHDAERGATGLKAPVGGRTLAVRPSAIILGRDFSALDFIDALAPRAGIYEALPGLLLRMESGRAREERLAAPGSPAWARLSGGKGSRGAGGSTLGAKYDFRRLGTEAGLALSFPWTSDLAGSVSVRHESGAADVSLADGGGRIELAGVGLGAGLSWENRRRWYASGEFSVMDYAADLSSKNGGRLKNGAGASVRSLSAEAGRRGVFRSAGFYLTPRAWLTRSEVSMDSFSDALGARFSLVNGNRLAGGAGVVAETHRPLTVGGGTLVLRGALDVGGILSGARTTVEVSGERLHSDAEQTRLLLGAGARWRSERFWLDAALSAGGPGSGDKTFAARLSLGMRF